MAGEKSETRRRLNVERSALFARREAAKVLKQILQGDSQRRSIGSIKSLVYSPSVRNKKGTFALVCKTLKHLKIIKQVLNDADILNSKWRKQDELVYIVTYDILFGQKQYKVQMDDLLPDLLILPSGSDLHDHPLVVNGSVFMQGKASSMVAAALAPKPGWEVLDACSAPGNKTVHLAALMGDEGKVIACELNEERIKRLKETIRLSGASNIKVLHGDFLQLNPEDPAYSKVQAILLDPSCSGSGTASARLDHLLPSSAPGHTADFTETERLNKLAAFQQKALAHALSFPEVERIVYSTCSVKQIENEDVVNSVLPLAESYGFELETLFPKWQRRGLPVFKGAERLLRTHPVEDKEGFFIALFVRKHSDQSEEPDLTNEDNTRKHRHASKRIVVPPTTNLFKIWAHAMVNRPNCSCCG